MSPRGMRRDGIRRSGTSAAGPRKEAASRRRGQEIAIDRAVLPPGTVGTARVRAAIERELSRLLAAEPAARGAHLPEIKVSIERGADADAIGVAVARQIHAALKKGDSDDGAP